MWVLSKNKSVNENAEDFGSKQVYDKRQLQLMK